MVENLCSQNLVKPGLPDGQETRLALTMTLGYPTFVIRGRQSAGSTRIGWTASLTDFDGVKVR